MQTAARYCQVTEFFSAGETTARIDSKPLGGNRPDFLFLFTLVGHDMPQIIRGIPSCYAEVTLCGCSGSGVTSP